MKKRVLALIMAGTLSAAVLVGCTSTEATETATVATEETVEEVNLELADGETVETAEEVTEAPAEEAAGDTPSTEATAEETLSTEATAEETPSTEATAEADSEKQVTRRSTSTESSESKAVYENGYYATDGNGTEFIILFYDVDGEDVAYLNDGTTDAYAKYASEIYEDEDGKEYVVVTIGEMGLTYFMEGEDLYIVDDDDNVYLAESLTEEEAEQIVSAVTE